MSSASRSSTWPSIHSRNCRSSIRPYLITSASPARNSRGGSVRSVSRSDSTARGWWNAPIMFLPPGWLTPVLPPTDGIDLGQQGRGHLHEVDAALVAGGREPSHVADDAAAERDDAGVAVQPALRSAHRRPGRAPHSVLYCSPSGSATERTRLPARAASPAREVKRADGLVGDDQYVARGDVGMRPAPRRRGGLRR